MMGSRSLISRTLSCLNEMMVQGVTAMASNVPGSDSSCTGLSGGASCSWKLCLFPYGNGSHSLALYLVPADVTSLPVGWSRKISFELSVVNATDAEKSVIKEAEHTFSRKVVDWGYRDLIELSQLHAPEGGFIVDGKMVISAKIWAADPDEEED